MSEGGNHGWLIIILVVALVWALFFHKQTYKGQTAEEWFNAYDTEVSRNQELEDSLNQANDNIDEANSKIDEAKSNAWGNYYDMGDALDNLETVDTVPVP